MTFKRCCGCDTLVPNQRPVCPHCHAYQFDPVEPESLDLMDEWNPCWLTEMGEDAMKAWVNNASIE